jgi:thioredoxin 1
MTKNKILHLAIATGIVALVGFASANAAERKVYDPASFAAAEASGARILVDISATWCPTCKAQKPIVDSLADLPVNKDLVIFAVDFDSQESVVRDFRAQMQSTLIAFKGSTETGRSVGDTDPDSIAALVGSNRAN